MSACKRVAVVHCYPSPYLFEVLRGHGYRVVYCGPAAPGLDRCGIEAHLDIPLHDEAECLARIRDFHCENPIDIVLPIYEGATVFNAKLAGELGLRGMTLATARAGRNKYLAYRKWAAAGVPVPKTVPLFDEKGGWQAVREQIGLPAVVKLADSMNSQGVIKVTDATSFRKAWRQLNRMLARPLSFDPRLDRNRIAYGQSQVGIIAQSFCQGVEVGVDLLVDGDQSLVTGIFEKAPSPGPYFVERMSVHPTSLGREIESELGELAVRAVTALGHRLGAAHVEIRYDAGGPKVLEAGLRPGGAYTVMAAEKLVGLNSYAVLASLLSGDRLPESNPVQAAVLYGGVIYPRSGKLASICGLEHLETMPGLRDVVYLNQVGDEVVAAPQSAQPHFAYYLLEGATRAEVIERHQHIQTLVKPIVAEAAGVGLAGIASVA